MSCLMLKEKGFPIILQREAVALFLPWRNPVGYCGSLVAPLVSLLRPGTGRRPLKTLNLRALAQTKIMGMRWR